MNYAKYLIKAMEMVNEAKRKGFIGYSEEVLKEFDSLSRAPGGLSVLSSDHWAHKYLVVKTKLGPRFSTCIGFTSHDDCFTTLMLQGELPYCGYQLHQSTSAIKSLKQLLSSGKTILDCSAAMTVVQTLSLHLFLEDHCPLEADEKFDAMFGQQGRELHDSQRLFVRAFSFLGTEFRPFNQNERWERLLSLSYFFAPIKGPIERLEKTLRVDFRPDLKANLGSLTSGLMGAFEGVEGYIDKHPAGTGMSEWCVYDDVSLDDLYSNNETNAIQLKVRKALGFGFEHPMTEEEVSKCLVDEYLQPESDQDSLVRKLYKIPPRSQDSKVNEAHGLAPKAVGLSITDTSISIVSTRLPELIANSAEELSNKLKAYVLFQLQCRTLMADDTPLRWISKFQYWQDGQPVNTSAEVKPVDNVTLREILKLERGLYFIQENSEAYKKFLKTPTGIIFSEKHLEQRIRTPYKNYLAVSLSADELKKVSSGGLREYLGLVRGGINKNIAKYVDNFEEKILELRSKFLLSLDETDALWVVTACDTVFPNIEKVLNQWIKEGNDKKLKITTQNASTKPIITKTNPINTAQKSVTDKDPGDYVVEAMKMVSQAREKGFLGFWDEYLERYDALEKQPGGIAALEKGHWAHLYKTFLEEKLPDFRTTSMGFTTHADNFSVKSYNRRLRDGREIRFQDRQYRVKNKVSATKALYELLTSGATVLDCNSGLALAQVLAVHLYLKDHCPLEADAKFDALFGSEYEDRPESSRLNITHHTIAGSESKAFNSDSMEWWRLSPSSYFYGQPEFVEGLFNYKLGIQFSPVLKESFGAIGVGTSLVFHGVENYGDVHPAGYVTSESVVLSKFKINRQFSISEACSKIDIHEAHGFGFAGPADSKRLNEICVNAYKLSATVYDKVMSNHKGLSPEKRVDNPVAEGAVVDGTLFVVLPKRFEVLSRLSVSQLRQTMKAYVLYQLQCRFLMADDTVIRYMSNLEISPEDAKKLLEMPMKQKDEFEVLELELGLYFIPVNSPEYIAFIKTPAGADFKRKYVDKTFATPYRGFVQVQLESDDLKSQAKGGLREQLGLQRGAYSLKTISIIKEWPLKHLELRRKFHLSYDITETQFIITAPAAEFKDIQDTIDLWLEQARRGEALSKIEIKGPMAPMEPLDRNHTAQKERKSILSLMESLSKLEKHVDSLSVSSGVNVEDDPILKQMLERVRNDGLRW